MIEIVREGCAVKVKIASDLPYEDEETSITVFAFAQEFPDVPSAELHKRYLQKRLGDGIQAIRKSEFFSGWRHAKARKRGKGYFRYFFSSLLATPTHG